MPAFLLVSPCRVSPPFASRSPATDETRHKCSRARILLEGVEECVASFRLLPSVGGWAFYWPWARLGRLPCCGRERPWVVLGRQWEGRKEWGSLLWRVRVGGDVLMLDFRLGRQLRAETGHRGLLFVCPATDVGGSIPCPLSIFSSFRETPFASETSSDTAR